VLRIFIRIVDFLALLGKESLRESSRFPRLQNFTVSELDKFTIDFAPFCARNLVV